MVTRLRGRVSSTFDSGTGVLSLSHPLSTLGRAELDRHHQEVGQNERAGNLMNTVTATPLRERLRDTAKIWARSQHELVTLAAEFADSGEWLLDGSTSAAAWLAQVADVDNEAELVELAKTVTASDLGRAIAVWLQRNGEPDAIDNHQQARRTIRWRTDPDGMLSFTVRVPPLLGGTPTMRSRSERSSTKSNFAAHPAIGAAHPAIGNVTATEQQRNSIARGMALCREAVGFRAPIGAQRP